MSNQLVPKPSADEIVNSVITKGDLSGLSAEEKTRYYTEVCKSVGLNPLTKPFEYITLNNKLTLYALRTCTDQLRAVHGVSVEELAESERDGVYVVTAKVRRADGRTDMAKGAVSIANLKGEALANAFMKAETKAKRRATLSVCGLGFLDETEVETIPGAMASTPPTRPAPKAAPAIEPPHDPQTGEVTPPRSIDAPVDPTDIIGWRTWGSLLIASLMRASTREEGESWVALNLDDLAECLARSPKAAGSVEKAIAAMRERLPEPEPTMPAGLIQVPDYLDADATE